ncbi:MAG: preprotein translocase subunit SecY [Patescibacteria group bacterium]
MLKKILEKLHQIWRARDLRKNLLYVLLMLVLFRIAANIPIPGVNVGNLERFFQGNQAFGLLNIFSGGALENFSIVLLGVGPYITASIIFQLLGMIVPQLEEMQKEGGEAGRRKINQYTRLLTVPIALMQSYATLTFLQRAGQGVILGTLPPFDLVTALITITGGTVLLMWIGELITERSVGNGISLLIFAGIISGIPTAIQQASATFDSSQLFDLIAFIVIALLTIAGVVFMTEGQRNIPVSYARQTRGTTAFGALQTYLPLRVNQAGVIPIIFAVSLVLFPSLVAQFLVGSSITWLAGIANVVLDLFNNQLFYGVFYFILVVAFSYFYTAVVFHPDQIAENLQKRGGFIPGIRPGRPTVEYLTRTSFRILLAGSLFLGVIAVMPIAVKEILGLGGQNLVVGGTSLLIVVSVVTESLKQIESQLVMRDYEGF